MAAPGCWCSPCLWSGRCLAPLVGVLADRIGPRPVLRTGLATSLPSTSGWPSSSAAAPTGWCRSLALLVAAGAGVALVQTPALTGATRSPAGQRGTGLGLFNMMRFVGAAIGTAAVAAAWPDGLAWLFAGCGLVSAAGLALSFLGREMALDEPRRRSEPG